MQTQLPKRTDRRIHKDGLAGLAPKRKALPALVLSTISLIGGAAQPDLPSSATQRMRAAVYLLLQDDTKVK